VLFRLLIVTGLSYLLPVLWVRSFDGEKTFVQFISVSLFCVCSTVISFYFIGMKSNERLYVRRWLQSKIITIRKN
jgi:hypothetical protein